MHVCLHTHTYTYTYMHTLMHTLTTYIHISHIHIYINTDFYMWTSIYVSMHTLLHTYIHSCMSIYIHLWYTYKHIYVHEAYTNAYTHAYLLHKHKYNLRFSAFLHFGISRLLKCQEFWISIFQALYNYGNVEIQNSINMDFQKFCRYRIQGLCLFVGTYT